MPKSLKKVSKHISKKKGGEVTALHENSRDSRSLRRAGGRDDKLDRMAAERKRHNRPILERALYFQEAVKKNGVKPFDLDAIHSLITTFVHQNDEELSALKKERRPGRPASTREDLLKIKIAADEKEYENGFYLPDLTNSDNVMALALWENSTWSYLSTLKWVRLSSSGHIQESKFPPKGSS
ncbi:hypothetical protein DSL72_001048 [Monilinia vaccinii-corymbosi]|uniref:Translation machinery-associated protein 16 n=1 Tax=Monilinia vaccinii-corymbosi TaxID=61207 RepID=A0A8A3P0Z8_9HELO|nr:hypothetical protein DSL72_001048 [Monilinia vaccinii-corymbosi]